MESEHKSFREFWMVSSISSIATSRYSSAATITSGARSVVIETFPTHSYFVGRPLRTSVNVFKQNEKHLPIDREMN